MPTEKVSTMGRNVKFEVRVSSFDPFRWHDLIFDYVPLNRPISILVTLSKRRLGVRTSRPSVLQYSAIVHRNRLN